MDEIEKLRDQAAKARRMAAGADPLTARLLTDFAEESEAEADRLEGQGGQDQV